MYNGFQIALKKDNFSRQEEFYNIGNSHISQYKTKVEEVIDSFVLADGSLDGGKMQDYWFPQINADIFISHSHRDEKLAIIFAGWLYDEFGLTAFIDSCVWGYANKLLRKIDDEYCYQPSNKTYNYQQRNYSTSHVHMMLSVALTQMIDNTECLFFLNTPHSITPESVIQQTESPWIYSEIAMSRLVRQKSLRAYRRQPIMDSFSAGGRLQVKYHLPTDHLINIDIDILSKWTEAWNTRSNVRDPKQPKYTADFQHHALDELYELTK